MSRNETIQLFALISALYPRDETFKAATSQMAATWAEMLADLDFQAVKTALKMHAATSSFPPAISDIRARVAELTDKDAGMTADDAWALVFKAIKRSALFSVQEFEKLPEACQRIVGSPTQLKDWALSENFNSGVEKAVFVKSYNNKENQRRELCKMPASVVALLVDAMPKGITDGKTCGLR